MDKTRVVHSMKSPYDVYIGRPGPWGNPFILNVDGTREQVIKKYKDWFLNQPDLIARARKELKGKILGCWCKPLGCHGDVIVEIMEEQC